MPSPACPDTYLFPEGSCFFSCSFNLPYLRLSAPLMSSAAFTASATSSSAVVRSALVILLGFLTQPGNASSPFMSPW
jgi:hypothetical protein